jgi:hypothetical protein
MRIFLGLLTSLGVLAGAIAPAWADTFWITTLEAVLGLDPDTLAIKKSIPMGENQKGALYLMPAPDGRTAYLLTGGREVVSVVDLKDAKVLKSWSLSETFGGAEEGPKIARARFYGLALDKSGKRLLGHVLTSRRTTSSDLPENAYKLDRLVLDRPYLALLDAQTGKRLATISDAPWATSFVSPMEDPQHPDRFLVISPDVDIIDLGKLPKGKAPVRAAYKDLLVKHVPLREPQNNGEGTVTILVEWFHSEISRGLGSMPFYGLDPVVGRDRVGVVTVDMVSGAIDPIETGPPSGQQYAFSTVVSPDRKKAYAIFNQLQEVDLEKRRLGRVENLPYTYYAGNMSPDGSKLYLYSGGARLAIVDPATMKITREVELPSEGWDAMTLPD